MLTRFCLAIFLVLSLSSCGDEALVNNVSARQSVELLVTLRKHGIVSSREQRESGRETNYDIFVASADYEKALEIIHEYKLPQEPADSFNELTEQRGFVPNSPEVMALRLDHALALEAERLILGLTGVVDVKVLIRSQLNSAGSWRGENLESNSMSNASVVVRLSKEAAASKSSAVEEIRSIVLKTVPGIKLDAIEVIASELGVAANDEEQAGLSLHLIKGLSFHVPESDRSRAYQSIFALIISSIVVGALFALAVFFWTTWKRKQQMELIRRHTMTFQRKSLLSEESESDPSNERRLR